MNSSNNQALITKFYTAFAKGNAAEMIDCYHQDIRFEDPAFGKLQGEEARNMWRMLLSRNSNIKIEFDNIVANDKTGSANWQATYHYGPKKRKVVNKIAAKFEFKGGKISKHTDHFDLWKWSRQALGFSGYLLGWSSFMRNKIQGTTNGLLRKFSSKK